MLYTSFAFSFQSTLPRGERRSWWRLYRWCCHFNPRSRVGSDQVDTGKLESVLISIHAPAWGATKNAHKKFLYGVISIHAPAWGATRFLRDILPRLRISIHAPAWGATQLAHISLPRIFISIHAPAWGATAKINKASCSKINTRSDIAIPLPKSGENKPFSPLFFYFDPHSRREGSGKILDTSPSRRITFIPGRVHPIKQ